MAIFTAIGTAIAAGAAALGASAAVVAGITASAFAVGLAATALVVSVSYSVYTANKMRKAAREAAEARKGFELVIDGGVQTLPIVYGRALIGGTRVYHNTSSTFKYASNNANQTFSLGARAVSAYGRTFFRETEQGTVEETEQISARPAGTLVQTINGANNEFLFFQQALCLGPIHAVYDVIIDDSQFLDDPSFGESESNFIFKSGAYVEDNDQKAALRIDYFYNGGADNLMAANFSERAAAAFPEIAYLSATIRLDRDQPQFSRVPALQTLIEGRTIKKITRSGTVENYSYTLNASREYSNNPAYCLLDYLLDTRVGKGLQISQIDLAEFYNAAQVCDTIVQPGSPVYVGGKIWQPTTPTRTPVLQRALPLYECNIIVDTSKPVRENVEKILSTMGDARLVWSQGKYKVLLQYPATNAQINVATTLTDDDLANDRPVEISWPGAGNRFNSATVKFSNEAQNFKEDSVSWPPKENQQYKRGIGGKKYLAVSGWDTVKTGGVFLNNYAVWQGNATTTSMQWKIIANETGTHTLRFTADDSITVTIGSNTFTHGDWRTIQTASVSLVANTEYTITVSANDNGGPRGAGAQLVSPSGLTLWTTRSDSYSAYINFAVTNTVYQQFLAEDNEVKLETEVFLDGVTDYYHALAKAEEIVRTSRTAATVKFEYIIKDKYLEPGDIIKINSATLKLGNSSDLYLKVDEIKIQDGAICEVIGSRFDSTQLAWNVKDSEFIKLPDIYSAYITAPYYLSYIPGVSVNGVTYNSVTDSPGRLEWASSPDRDLTEYVLYFHQFGELDANGYEIFKEIGRASASPFSIPNLGSVPGIFGVRAVTTRGMSGMTVSTTATVVTKIDAALKPGTINNLSISITGEQKESLKLQWVLPVTTINTNIKYSDHAYVKIFRAKVIAPTLQETSPVLNFVEIGTSSTLEFIDTPTEYGDLAYKIKFVSTRNLISEFSNQVQSTVDYWQRFESSIVPPDMPSLNATAFYSSIQLSWSLPTYTIATGRHGGTAIYVATWPQNTPQPTSGTFLQIVVGESLSFVFAAEPATRYVFWIKAVSRGGTYSANFTGPATAQTSLDVTNALESLKQQIGSSQLNAELGARVNLIDAPNTGLVSITADLQTVFGTTQAAANSAANALASASAAANSASNAAANALAAANAATSAASNATASVNSAINSAANALASANAAANAIASELAAAGYSLTSANNASNAFNYANASANSASNASGSAANASNSAAQAASSSNTASNSAANALNYSNSSASSASNASGSASSASNSAIQAANSANAASGSAANALNYSTSSANSAINAAGSASDAATSATQAANSANGASNSSANALNYSNSSANSASNAAGSASNASNSAIQAANSANAASGSAASALNASNSSANSATNASGSASNAATSATQAASSANAASNSAANALNYSNSSASSASNASGSASNASNSAVQAANSANAASGSAASALNASNSSANSATNASGSASNAATSATQAASSANAASNSAANALNYSNSSASSASNASGSASNAANSAVQAANSANAASGSAASALNASNSSANSATNASGSASNAATSATQAANSSNAASNSAANALNYSNSSANSASNASGSASNAATSATTAVNAKNDATDSAANALIYRNQAANSATNAAGSASNASTSEGLAVAAKNAAANAEANALTYRNQAANSASNASGSASNASTSEGLAVAAKNAAINAEANALTYRNQAANSASNASGSASNASTSEGLAVAAKNAAINAEANALTYRNQAANSATNAAGSASNASTSEGIVVGAKNAAANSEANALTYRNQAATSATSASNSANSAATSLNGVLATVRGTTLSLPFEQWNLGPHSVVTISGGKVGDTALRLIGSAGSYPTQPEFIAINPFSKYRVKFWARPSTNGVAGATVTTTGLLYFSLRQFTAESLSSPGPTNGGRSPYKPSGISRATHLTYADGENWFQYDFTWTSTDWQPGVKYFLPEFLDNYTGAAGHWDIQGFTIQDTTDIASVDAAVQQKMTAKASSNGEVLASYSVVVDTNGYVSGFGLSSSITNGTSAAASTFQVRADKFAITGTSTSPTPENPFTVLTSPDSLGNPPGVYLDRTFIKTADITLAQINTATVTNLSAISANVGTLRTATSGSRVEIRDNIIIVYEGSSPRVKIGNLNLN